MARMVELPDYGWVSDREPLSCEYVAPVVLKILDRVKAESVIDIGCGNGALCRRMLDAGHVVVGVEPDEQGITLSRQRCPEAAFYQLRVEEPPEKLLSDYPAGFEAAVATEVVEHLYEPRLLLRFAHKVLTDRGFLIMSTPYHGYLKNLVLSVVDGWDRHFDSLRTGGHIKFFSHKTMSILLESEGFEVCWLGGAGRVPYMWKSMIVVARKRSL